MDLATLLRGVKNFGLEFLGLYYSVYPGYIIDNEDPDGMGKLKVSVNTVLSGASHLLWALPHGVFSGNGYGSQVMPSVGDMVWVEFQHGKLRFPVWSFYYPLKGHKPKEFKDIKQYGFKSPNGHLVLINDTDDEITVVHKDGSLVKITEKVLTVKSTTIVLESEDVHLNKDDSDQPIPLGTKLDEDIKSLLDIVTGVQKSLLTLSSELAPITSAVTVLSPLSASFTKAAKSTTELTPKITSLRTHLSNKYHLSNKSKTN